MKNMLYEAVLALAGILVIVLFAAAVFVYSLPELEPEHQLELPPEEKRMLHSMDKPVQLEPEYVAGIGPVLEDMPELKPVETVTTQSRYSDWNVEDFKTLTHLVMAEAEGEPYEGKIAIVNTVLNRCRNRGQSIKEVVFAENQFCSSGKRFELEPSEECVDAVVAALMDGVAVIPDNVEYFRRIDKPDQEKTEVVCQIGNHKFAREVK